MREDKIKRILVVRVRRMGDALLTLPLLYSLKETFPNASLDFIVNEPMDDLFVDQQIIDNVIKIPSDINNGSFLKYINWVRKVMKNKEYDIIIDCRTTVKTLFFSIFSFRTPFRIGLSKKYNFLIHNKRLSIDSNLNKIEEMCSLMKPLEAKFVVVNDYKLKLDVSETEKKRMTEYLVESGIDLYKPIILCNVATRDTKKQWDISKMTKVIQYIVDTNPEFQLIFNYAGEDEKKVATQLHNEITPNHNIFINIEAKSLKEFPALVSQVDFFFGNEGGARHIVDAIGKPSFALFSPGISIAKWIRERSDFNDGIELPIEGTGASDGDVDLICRMLSEKFANFVNHEKLKD